MYANGFLCASRWSLRLSKLSYSRMNYFSCSSIWQTCIFFLSKPKSLRTFETRGSQEQWIVQYIFWDFLWDFFSQFIPFRNIMRSKSHLNLLLRNLSWNDLWVGHFQNYDHPSQICFNLVQRFQRRRFKCDLLSKYA
jgi:hypothetical protein